MSKKSLIDNTILINLDDLNAQDLARIQVIIQRSTMHESDIADLTSQIMQTGIGNAGLSDYLEELQRADKELEEFQL